MNGSQLGAKNFIALVEVGEIAPGKVFAGITVAMSVHRLGAGLVSGIAQLQHASTGEEVAIAGVSGGHHAVEHIDTAPDAFQQIRGCAHSHQVSRFFRR